ncbi:scavenger receptor class A member 5-like [Magallana gigas]|uniref:scavenger receptor class A member 5-like n=1 Tax=Magallana gigas TaxID=29159 RepID=UPI003342759C
MENGAYQKQSAPYGQGSGHIVLDDVNCIGSETFIGFCNHQGYMHHNCGHVSVELVGGSSSKEGRVVVRRGNTEGTVCDDNWDNNDARVVCRMLGYHGTARAVALARFGQGSGQIWMDEVKCTGSETSLAKCPFIGYGINDCSHSEDAGVICQ